MVPVDAVPVLVLPLPPDAVDTPVPVSVLRPVPATVVAPVDSVPESVLPVLSILPDIDLKTEPDPPEEVITTVLFSVSNKGTDEAYTSWSTTDSSQSLGATHSD